MNLKFSVIIILVSYALVDSLSTDNLPKVNYLKSIKISLTKMMEELETIAKDMHKGYNYLTKTSSGRKPCVWKICSKPLKIDQNPLPKSKDVNEDFLKHLKMKIGNNGGIDMKKFWNKILLKANNRKVQTCSVF